MWIWRGQIVPEPGEHIKRAAEEAIALCHQFGADTKGKTYGGYPSQGYFELTFNGVKISVWADSTVDGIVQEYEESRKSEKGTLQEYEESRKSEKGTL